VAFFIAVYYSKNMKKISKILSCQSVMLITIIGYLPVIWRTAGSAAEKVVEKYCTSTSE